MERQRYTVFPESTPHMTPYGLYESLHNHIENPRNEIFFSHPISSAGVKDFVIHDTPLVNVPKEEEIPFVINANRNVALKLVQETEENFQGRLTVPANIGLRDGWGEFDYTRFWFYYISGIEPQNAAQFERMTTSSPEKNIFNDYHGERKSREELYDTYTTDFIRYVSFSNTPINPVSKIVFLPDHYSSLGCRTEQKLAKALQIPTSSLFIDGPDEFPDNLVLYSYCRKKGILPQ